MRARYYHPQTQWWLAIGIAIHVPTSVSKCVTRLIKNPSDLLRRTQGTKYESTRERDIVERE